MTEHTLLATDIGHTVGIPLVSLLATRVVGKQFLAHLQSQFDNQHNEIPLKLSFAGIEVMDASFADEVFGSLCSQRARKGYNFSPLILVDINLTCKDNLQMALETRIERESKELERLRNCVIPAYDISGLQLIGKYEDHVQQTFSLLSTHCTLTARSLADILRLNVNAASTRLKTLADLGLALRIEKRDSIGKQFVYHSLM